VDCSAQKECATSLKGVSGTLNQTDQILEAGEQACNNSWVNSHCTGDIVDTNHYLGTAHSAFQAALKQCQSSTAPVAEIRGTCTSALTQPRALLAKLNASMKAARCKHSAPAPKAADCLHDLQGVREELQKLMAGVTSTLGSCALHPCEGSLNGTALELATSAQAIEAGIDTDCHSPFVSLRCFSDYLAANGGFTRATAAFSKALDQCSNPIGTEHGGCRQAQCACTDPQCTSPCPAGFVCFGDAKCCPREMLR